MPPRTVDRITMESRHIIIKSSKGNMGYLVKNIRLHKKKENKP